MICVRASILLRKPRTAALADSGGGRIFCCTCIVSAAAWADSWAALSTFPGGRTPASMPIRSTWRRADAKSAMPLVVISPNSLLRSRLNSALNSLGQYFSQAARQSPSAQRTFYLSSQTPLAVIVGACLDEIPESKQEVLAWTPRWCDAYLCGGKIAADVSVLPALLRHRERCPGCSAVLQLQLLHLLLHRLLTAANLQGKMSCPIIHTKHAS